MLKSSNCGNLNDFAALEKVAEEEAMRLAEEDSKEIVDNITKKLNKTISKGCKNIDFKF